MTKTLSAMVIMSEDLYQYIPRNDAYADKRSLYARNFPEPLTPYTETPEEWENILTKLEKAKKNNSYPANLADLCDEMFESMAKHASSQTVVFPVRDSVTMTETSAPFPKTVKFNPIIGLKSFHIPEAGGAWRLFVLAKNLAVGNDHVGRETLREYAASLGVHEKTFKRWLEAARSLDLVCDVQRQSGEWMLILTSNAKAASIMGIESKGRAVTMPAKLIVGKQWRAYVFAGFEATFNGRLISRKKQAELSGIPEATQRKYDKEAGVKRQKNYAVSSIHANGYSAVMEFGNRAGLYKYWDRNTHQLKLGWRLPDSRSFDGAITNGSKKSLGALSLFNRTYDHYKATVRKLSKSDSSIREVYLYSHRSRNGADMWTHCPLR